MGRGQVLSNVTHGGHILDASDGEARSLARSMESATLASSAVEQPDNTTPFDYLFPDLAHNPDALLPADDTAAVVDALNRLGDAMVEQPASPGDELQAADNSTIPTVYTYWGQFIDHDLTANTDRDTAVFNITRPDLAPLAPDTIVVQLRNLRQPTLNLDSVYGDGPTFAGQPKTVARSFYNGSRFKIGHIATTSDVQGVRIPPVHDLKRDLPRRNFKAQIADSRNDENLIIAQLHTVFLRFHNELVERLDDAEFPTDQAKFERAQQLMRWHYQWLVVNDYLRTVTLAGMVDKVLLAGPRHYPPSGEPFMPLEFSVAAFRFGHTMVRGTYDHCRNFGRAGEAVPPAQPNTPLLPHASFQQLFAFTGNGHPKPFPFPGTTKHLPSNWCIEWDRFVDKGSPIADHFARKIDTVLAPPLRDMVNEGNDPSLPVQVTRILKRLARRNLLRGYLLSIPTGQSVAGAIGVEPLSASELQQGNSIALNEILAESGFLQRTPLWFYVLKEAEVRANGNSLGELGSRIVCETIIGQLRRDPDSFLNQPGGWDPTKGMLLDNGDPIVTIGDFIRFAGLPA